MGMVQVHGLDLTTSQSKLGINHDMPFLNMKTKPNAAKEWQNHQITLTRDKFIPMDLFEDEPVVISGSIPADRVSPDGILESAKPI